MKTRCARLGIAFALLTSLPLSVSAADAKVEEQVLAPEGKWIGCAISPKGVHTAVLLAKGSRFAVALDGVEGPRVDQLFTPDGQAAVISASVPTQDIPVLFSDDGAHSAYFAKLGSEYLVVLDGKELVRGPITPTGRFINLRFSAGGKHVFHVETEASKGQRVFVDGKPGPWGQGISEVATSPDGAHYAYTGQEAGGAQTKWAVVDGKQVKYFGRDLKFTVTGALLSVLDGQGFQAQILNGKPVIQAAGIPQVWVAPTGPLVATLVLPKANQPTVLAVNGKPVPGTEGLMIAHLYFSPDGKRWAASCRSQASASFVIIDGKKGQEYQSLQDSGEGVQGTDPYIGFTPDSSKFYYIAQQGGQSFLVVEEEEWDGIAGNFQPSVGGGNRLGFIGAESATGKKFVVVDNKAKERPGANFLKFSPDGSRYAFVAGISASKLWVDGVEVPGIDVGPNGTSPRPDNSRCVFSPDSKHYVASGFVPRMPGLQGLYLNGQLVWKPDGNGHSQFNRTIFTPNSQHLFWIAPRLIASNEDKDPLALYVDGKQTINFSANVLESRPGNWEMSPEGVLTFVAISGNELKRFRVTPSPDANLSTLLANAPK